MEVNEINGVKFIDALPGESQSAATLAENFDNFLTLLTTQLQSQDPLSPLDTTEFTNQLTNFAQVEQIINSNNKLDRLIELQGPAQQNTGVAYIGKLVEAPGDAMLLQDGGGRIGYELSSSAARTTIAILNDAGSIVRLAEGQTTAGRHLFDWDGTDESGNTVPDGAYQVLVTALDTDNNAMDTTVTTFGKVTGVEIEDGAGTLILGPLSVGIDSILSVHEFKQTGT